MSGLDGSSITSLVCALAGAVANVSPGLLYWTPALAATTCTLLLAIRPVICPRTQGSGTTLFSWLLAATFVLLRWPLLTLGELNPDESQILASAITLAQDPVFWRSIDPGSHGPLVEYPLLLLHLSGLSVDYGLSKLAGMLMMAGSLVLLYQALRLLFSDACARLTVFTPAIFLGFTSYCDFLAYNAETPTLLLLCAALFLVSRLRVTEGLQRGTLGVLCGLCLGCVPWAKLQGIPIAGALGLWCLAELWRVRRNRQDALAQSALVLGAGVTPSAVFLCVLGLLGLWEQFYVRYIVQNFFYVSKKAEPFWKKLLSFYVQFDYGQINTFFFRSVLLVTAILLVLFLILCLRNSRLRTLLRPALRTESSTQGIYFSGLAFFLTVYSIIAPGNYFAHYYLFIFIFAAVFQCALLFIAADTLRDRVGPSVILAFFSLTLSLPFVFFKHTYRDNTSIFKEPYICRGQVNHFYSDVILEYASPEATVAVWGWFYDVYVHTGRRIPTRTTPMHIFGIPALREFYLNDYINQLIATQPDIFIDAISPDMFAYDDKAKYGFETVPQLAAFINGNYDFISDINGVRLYVSRKQPKMIATLLQDLPVRVVRGINRARATSGEGVVFLDPRIIDSAQIMPYTDAAFYASTEDMAKDSRIHALASRMLQYIDFEDANYVSIFIRRNGLPVNYVVTHATLENTVPAGMKLVYNDRLIRIYKLEKTFSFVPPPDS